MGHKPLRVLQVVRAVPGGGAEAWLLKMIKQFDPGQFKFDFCALWPPSASFCTDVAALGARVKVCPLRANLATFPIRFRRMLRVGQYDVVHAHVGLPTGLVLRQAMLERVPTRIAHSHNSDDLHPNSLLRNAWRAAMRGAIQRYATSGLACSEEAARFLFGPEWRSDARFRVFHCGINLDPFRTAPSREETRREFGIPVDAPVVGHVGLFERRKNQAFLLQVGREILKVRPDARFLLVGDGPLRPQVEAMTREYGMEKNVVFAGQRSERPSLDALSDGRVRAPILRGGSRNRLDRGPGRGTCTASPPAPSPRKPAWFLEAWNSFLCPRALSPGLRLCCECWRVDEWSGR